MKSYLKKWPVLFLSLLFFVAACNNTTTDDAKDTDNDTASTRSANADANKTLRDKDQNFAKDVVAANIAEVKMAQLASQKATNKEVKDLAQMLEKDHSAALSELRGVATNKNIQVPAEETGDAKDTYEKFNKKSGKEFDKDWCELMEKKHKESIDKFENLANDAEADADLKAFANKTLPTLRSHLDHVMQC